MEQLTIRGFLTIKSAEVDFRRITVLIGPQANGKSIVAKLLYFFRQFISREFVQSVELQTGKRDLKQAGLAQFQVVFPSYAWSDQNFEIEYHCGDLWVQIKRTVKPGKRNSLILDYSSNLADLHVKAKNYCKKATESLESRDRGGASNEASWLTMRECIQTSPIGDAFVTSVFVPASRSFFANLQRNVFSFLANNITIDPLIKEFGSAYENSKRTYSRMSYYSAENRSQTARAFREEIRVQIEKILVGKYLSDKDQDWIVSEKRRINLANASSGQQEALPMLLVLAMYLAWGSLQLPVTFFIEEPEAHLFPSSQRQLVELFAKLYNRQKRSFVLTTHSPYVLTALNNLIMADNLLREKGHTALTQLEQIVPAGTMIRYEDVSAYTISDGVLESILEPDLRLIGSSIIDSVSDDFENVFSKLMELGID